MTNWESWFQPWLVLVVEESGKWPSIWMPGTPRGVASPSGVSPAQSAGSVWPEATVPAVVNSVRQEACWRSAPGTFSVSTREQWAGRAVSWGGGAAVAGAAVKAVSAAAARAAGRSRRRGRCGG